MCPARPAGHIDQNPIRNTRTRRLPGPTEGDERQRALAADTAWGDCKDVAPDRCRADTTARALRAQTRRRRQSGFSLVEMAMALMVITIAFGSLTRVGIGWADLQRLEKRRNALELSRQALISYALEHGHLPCPSARNLPNNRIEARNGVNCVSYSGNLATASLGLDIEESSMLRYFVSPEFADSEARAPGSWPCVQEMLFASFNLCDPGRQRIYSGLPLNSGSLVADDVAAVIVDSGSPVAPRNANERENLDDDRSFVRAGRGDSYDDEIVWISANTIKFQLTRAGLLY